jgi:hypothetical protein
MDRSTKVPASSRSALTTAVDAVPGLLGLPGRVCRTRFRGESVTVVADTTADRSPITDVLSLELVSGSGEDSDWPRPVVVHAVVVTGRDALRAVQRASQWASYAARVAIVPADRVSDHVLAEAGLRGVWLLTAEPGKDPRVVSPGETGLTLGAARGLLHRLLDEVVLEAMQGSAVRSA